MRKQFGKFWASVTGRPAPEEAKALTISSAWLQVGGAYWPGRGVERLIEQGYCANPVAHRCARLVIEAASSVPLQIEDNKGVLSDHPLLALLARPNVWQGRVQLLDQLYSNLVLEGAAFIERVDGADDMPAEIYALPPSQMTVKRATSGWPEAYEYRTGKETRHYPIDPVTARTSILHITMAHPRDPHRGVAPLQVAAGGIDSHNAASDWNKALLDNAARPSGALVFEPRDGQSDVLTEDQINRLRDQMSDYFQGSANAGRPFLLEGGLKWQQVAMSPIDMDFISSKNNAAREIALGFGVPPMLLGIPGDNTYANYAEANRAFWRQTIIPMILRVADCLGHWLGQSYDDPVALKPDLDDVPALADERQARWARVGLAPFLNDEEKRRLLGLPPGTGTPQDQDP